MTTEQYKKRMKKIIEKGIKNYLDLSNEEHKLYSKWLPDEETLKNHLQKFARTEDGLLIYDTEENAKKYMGVDYGNSCLFIDMENEKIREEKDRVKEQEAKIKKGWKKLNKQLKKVSYLKISLKKYKQILHKWWYFEDDEIIDIQLAGLIGEKIPGDPLWIFIIAPPGALKTEQLRSFANSDDFFPLSDLTSKTFVSGLMLGSGEKRRKIEDLLPQLNGKVIIFKDFTTVLEKSKEERQQIFAQLREIYDGSFSKKFGTIDKTIRYKSRFGLVAGVTPIVDKYWKLMQQLGERFLKIRWDEDIKKVTVRARQMEGKEKPMRKEISKYAMGFITNLDFSKVPKFNDKKHGELLDQLAEFVAISRTPVVIQDYRKDFYYDYIPTPERPTRLVKQLKKLCKCLALIRGKNKVDDEEIKTILRVAKDTIPQDRLAVLETINANNADLYGCSRTILNQSIKIPETSIGRVLEQLKLLDLISEKKITEEGSGYTNHRCFYQLNSVAKVVLSGVTFTEGIRKSQGGEHIDNSTHKIEKKPIKPDDLGKSDIK